MLGFPAVFGAVPAKQGQIHEGTFSPPEEAFCPYSPLEPSDRCFHEIRDHICALDRVEKRQVHPDIRI